MIKYLIPFLLISSCAHLPKQIDQGFLFKKISDLPPSINESSGLIVMDGKLITHNDSGNMAMLYELDTTGTITNYIKYNYLTNRDWEAIAQSDKAIHIADIGNNQGDRKDLKIYHINKGGIWQKEIDIDISSISYSTQTNFKKRSQRHSYDAEAIIVIDEVMYLFSKDWINYSTTVYNLQLYSDTLLKSSQVINTKGLVTDAAFNNDNTVLLCGYNQSLQPFMIQLEYNNGIFKMVKKIDLPIEGAQIEAIAYYGKDTNGKDIYYLTSEAVNVKLGDDEAKIIGELYKLIW
ncbi:Gll0560 protein [Nonlabens ulvanivorans]|nr:Gll0560 protein [Nonlabens ulvanivorans]